MSALYVMTTIVDRKMAKKFSVFYEENGLKVSASTLGGKEKSIFFHIVTDDKWKELKRQLRSKMKIDIPGIGIVFIIPVSSVGGKKVLSYLTSGQEFQKGDESALKDTKYELLVAIANQGYTEMVMDAARKVHAAGGTVLHAKGTGSQMAEKFMGVTLVPEKELVLIVVRKDQKNDIMRSIMDEAGTGTKAGAVVFSLPVTDTAGMRLMEEIEE